ncbi:MAG: hypothetical protein AMQ22_00094 [Candidatus Methanofastidiosum methylothiophilum]|uniref:Uncharacterized protein n=1 Tax=Candidatus Methanofastidiosum methylothiophilum TaxID=1705564 RepID=A0A150JAB9_9EURY|nr:MAG: hypothetical protein AMQ22_00094 [Candidatus Methanofastidiosum methylthiophilus]
MIEIEHKASLAKGDIIKFNGVKYRIKEIDYYECHDPMILPEGKIKKDDPLRIPEVEPLEIKTVLDLEILDKKDLKKVDYKIEVESFTIIHVFDGLKFRFTLNNGKVVELNVNKYSLADMVDKYGNSIRSYNGFIELVNSLEIPGEYKKAVNQYINQNMSIILDDMRRGF